MPLVGRWMFRIFGQQILSYSKSSCYETYPVYTKKKFVEITCKNK